jgi:hypothetical protein
MNDTTADIRDRVSNGVALLDERVANWRDRVCVGSLWIESADTCVLGQIYGDYDIGIEALNILGEGKQYGFSTYSRSSTYGLSEYAELQAEWVRVLTDA